MIDMYALSALGAWFGRTTSSRDANIFISYCFKTGRLRGRGAGVFAGKGCSYVPMTEVWLRARAYG